MLPRPWPRMHRRKSTDSLGSNDERFPPAHHGHHTPASETVIPHASVFLDDHLPAEYFRQDVIRLIHQLRIPGWSLVSVNMANDLDMTRISGALTNSVYSVRAPKHVKDTVKREHSGKACHHKLPTNLLLRVYGPNVDLLIDRPKELRTVAELTKHNIGPRLLGTFQNGRFEQFLNAQPLTRHDLRVPETSVQIAKRMCDLHKNVPVSASDAAGGAVVWQYLAKWTPTAQKQMQRLEDRSPGTTQQIIHRPDFAAFVEAVAKYRRFLDAKYPATPQSLHSLVFCHNDTQYGNILRLDPPRGSPLLQPQNEHRKLVVIDFEFSGPNPRAIDIANHFSEWMGDYHHPTMPHHIWLDRYPTPEEQRRFVTSYVEHGAEVFDEAVMDRDIETLISAAADWRAAVSAFWAMWGIVQTPLDTDQHIRDEYLEKDPQYELTAEAGESTGSPADPVDPASDNAVEEDDAAEEDDAFDYLQYSREKMALFWADYEKLGL